MARGPVGNATLGRRLELWTSAMPEAATAPMVPAGQRPARGFLFTAAVLPQTHFNPGTAEIVYLRGQAVNSVGIYAALLIAHQRFPAQLEEDSLVFWLAHCDCTLRCRVDAMNEDSTAPRSYVF